MITGKIVDGIIELTGQQGTTWEYDIELYQDDENTIPFSLANYFARGQYRKDKSPDSLLLIEFICTVPDIHITTNPFHNKVHIKAEASQSSALNSPELRVHNQPVFKGYFDVEIYQLDGANEINVMRPIDGRLIVTPEITR